MKLIRFSIGDEAPRLGLVANDCALAFDALQSASGQRHTCLDHSTAYLEALPGSEAVAKSLLAWTTQNWASIRPVDKPALGQVRLHAPIEVKALFDLGLTPRHLSNSVEVMLKYEKDNPQTGPLVEALRRMLQAPRPAPTPGVPERMSYYKSNLNSVCGDGTTVPWPVYTSRLDIEPELAVVYGNASQPVAGYCIFNDVSARDVQAAEILGGFCLSKDMAKGNQLGPYLVTPDEVGDPFSMAVSVTVNGEERYRGTTAEISHKAEDVFRWLGMICPLTPGSVMGFGTIPDCTAMDNDVFIDPGSEIAIHFERLGTLHCKFAEPTGKLLPSRWPLRDALTRFHA